MPVVPLGSGVPCNGAPIILLLVWDAHMRLGHLLQLMDLSVIIPGFFLICVVLPGNGFVQQARLKADRLVWVCTCATFTVQNRTRGAPIIVRPSRKQAAAAIPMFYLSRTAGPRAAAFYTAKQGY